MNETLEFREKIQLAPNTIISDRYRIREVLGHGGFATVYTAEHIQLESVLAIKVLDPPVSMTSAKSFFERFHREARVAAKIEHPNVVRVSDYGIFESTNQPYLVMDRLVKRPANSAGNGS